VGKFRRIILNVLDFYYNEVQANRIVGNNRHTTEKSKMGRKEADRS
jgi:hypothetical protein